MLKDFEIVKKITINEKIEFWRKVMEYAHNRGIEVYWFTWNIFSFRWGNPGFAREFVLSIPEPEKIVGFYKVFILSKILWKWNLNPGVILAT